MRRAGSYATPEAARLSWPVPESLRDVDLDEFRVEEWRLERLLHVNHFREPPDYRIPEPGQRIANVKLTLPFLRLRSGTSAGDATACTRSSS